MELMSGVLLAVLGGALMGSFTAPIKFSKKWAWENTWLLYSLIGLLCIPLATAFISVPDLFGAYRSAGSRALALVALFGFGWGVGSVLLGIGIDMLGISLGFPIILGLTSVLGALIPLIVLSPEALHSVRGANILMGLIIVVFGIILCAKAGGMRSGASDASGLTRSRYRAGLLICIGSGMFNAMLNLALAFGTPIAKAATQRSVGGAAAQNAIWALAVSAGSLANIGYSLLLLFRNQTWRAFRASGSATNLLLAALMGVLWMAGITVYGRGAASLGDLGTVVAWPLFMSMIIVTGGIWGFLTGEWKQAPRVAWRVNLAGMGMLIAAIAIISIGAVQ